MRTAGLFPFSNTEAMKEKVRHVLRLLQLRALRPVHGFQAKAPYHVHQCYHRTGLFQYLARHPYFENLTLGVIVVNAFWISVDTDGNTAETLLTAKPHFVVADVMNMLIGVLCEVISSVAQEEQESMVVEKVNDKFSAIVRELDTDNDGTLSWSEFEKIIDYPDAVAALDSVNVDPVGIVEMAEDLFWEDGAEVTVSFEEFMELVLDLRGGQPASVKDMRLGKKFSQKFFSMNTKINRIDEKLDVIYAKLNEMWKL